MINFILFSSISMQVDDSNIAPTADDTGFQFNQTPNIPNDGFKF